MGNPCVVTIALASIPGVVASIRLSRSCKRLVVDDTVVPPLVYNVIILKGFVLGGKRKGIVFDWLAQTLKKTGIVALASDGRPP